eukprot:1626452-Prymnesium_polylepis.1
MRASQGAVGCTAWSTNVRTVRGREAWYMCVHVLRLQPLRTTKAFSAGSAPASPGSTEKVTYRTPSAPLLVR